MRTTADDPVYLRNHNYDRSRETAIASANKRECDGWCSITGECAGGTKAVRVARKHGTDWGWFSYCETARSEDLRRGLFFPDEA